MLSKLIDCCKKIIPIITMNNNSQPQESFMTRVQYRMSSMMQKYAIARRAILVFMMYIIYRLVDVTLDVYVKNGTIATEMVDIIAMFVTILTIFSCFYTASRFSEINTDKIKTKTHQISLNFHLSTSGTLYADTQK